MGIDYQGADDPGDVGGDLLAQDGQYALMFNTQAERYR